MKQTLRQRRSSCLLWFQIVGVETYLLLPHDQGDRGNLPRQSQACHRRLPSLGEQIVVEIAQWSSGGAGSHRRTLKNVKSPEMWSWFAKPSSIAGSGILNATFLDRLRETPANRELWGLCSTECVNDGQ